jgi:hypothetical protein
MIGRRLRTVLLGGMLLPALAAGAAAQSAVAPPKNEPKVFNTQDEVLDYLGRCYKPPGDVFHPGMEITIRFALNRDGEVLGEPRFTYMTRVITPAIRAAYQRAVIAMIKRCTPVRMTPTLGGAVAGRPLSLRFVDTRGQRGA